MTRAILVLSLIGLAQPALAQQPYDGTWFVTMSCGPTIYHGAAFENKPFRMEVVDGKLTPRTFTWTVQNNSNASRRIPTIGSWFGKITGNQLEITNRVEFDDPERTAMTELVEMRGPAESPTQFTARGERRQLSTVGRSGTVMSGCQVVFKKDLGK